MSRQSVNHPEAMVAPKKIILPNGWDENLKIKFNKIQKKEIEWKVYSYIERHNFNERKLSFDDIENRLNNIINGADQILRAFPYPHPNYSSDNVHVLIEQEIEFKLSKFYNGNFSETPSLIMHHVSVFREAAVLALNDLQDSHPKQKSGPRSDDNLNWFYYDLGAYYHKCGGKFAMSETPSSKHPFYNFLLAINKHLPKYFRLNEEQIIYRAIKMSKLFRKNQKNKKC